MALTRLSRLQKRILQWLAADERRTHGVIASSHQELVQALQGDKSHISHSLQTLERHGLLIIGRSPGGHAEYLRLTPAGHQRVAQLTGSCDEEKSPVEIMRCLYPSHRFPSTITPWWTLLGT